MVDPGPSVPGIAIRTSIVWCRGSLDNKAGMTSAIMVARALKKSGVQLKGGFIMSGNIDEEDAPDDSNLQGMKAKAKEYNAGKIPKAAFCFWTDCSDGLHIYVSQYALCVLEVRIKGKTTHPGTPRDGINAITKAQRFLTLLEEYGDEQWENKFDPLQGRPNNVVTYIKGGHLTQLAVPEECGVAFLRRGVPGADPLDAEMRITIAACDLLLGRDEFAMRFIQRCRSGW
jgi:acetylornithine deacetylase/succinyl-diaminopimelate desuccinylase-like protein